MLAVLKRLPRVLFMSTMSLPVRPYRLSQIRDAEALAVGNLLASVWPRPDRGPVERAEQVMRVGRDYDGPASQEPISFIVWQEDEVVAHALTFGRTVQTSGGGLTVMGLAMVAADPACRGQGLGAGIVKAAFERVDSGVFPFALFQTSNEVQSFYERLGCQRVENRIVNSLSEGDPGENPFWDDLVMRYPSQQTGGDAWPTGDIDLCGRGY